MSGAISFATSPGSRTVLSQAVGMVPSRTSATLHFVTLNARTSSGVGESSLVRLSRPRMLFRASFPRDTTRNDQGVADTPTADDDDGAGQRVSAESRCA